MQLDIDDQITLAEEKLEKLRDLKAQLDALLSGEPIAKKQRVCGKCGLPGHQARTCVAVNGSAEQA